MQREGDRLVVVAVRLRAALRVVAETGVVGKPVHRKVVYVGPDPLGPQRVVDEAARGAERPDVEAQAVEVTRRRPGRAVELVGDLGDGGELPVVTGDDLAAPLGERGKATELALAERGLDVAHAVVVAELELLVVPAALVGPPHEGAIAGDAVLGEEFDAPREPIIHGRNRAALARGHGLHRVETEAGDVGDRPHLPAVRRARADGVGGVLYEDEAVPVADLAYRRVVDRNAAEVDGHDRLGAPGDGGLDGGRVDVPRLRVDVGEHRGRAAVEDAVRRRGEGDGAHDDLVARPYPRGEASDVERGRAVRDRGDVGRARLPFKRALERRGGGAAGEPVAPQDGDDSVHVRLVDVLVPVAHRMVEYGLPAVDR